MFTVLFLSMFEIKRRSRAFVMFVGVNLVRTVRLCGDDDVAFDIVFSTFLSHKKIETFSLRYSLLFLSRSLLDHTLKTNSEEKIGSEKFSICE